jgi:RNA polymerase sigma-70 factor, ECF subfamily
MPDVDGSFERAYRRYLPAVAGYLHRRVDRAHVEDLAADVFAIAWHKRAAVVPGEELPWLYRIAANVVANHRRKQATGSALLAALRPADPAPSAEDLVTADVALADAWRGLRPAEREILSLALVEDLAPAAVATALGITPNAAAIRLHRARTKLAALLARGNPTTG